MVPVTVDVGQRLAERYRLDECLVRREHIEVWRAFDELLARPVGIHIMAAEHSRARHVIAAAQVAATITDTRFLRILDAAEEDGLVYVVREWVGGNSLSSLIETLGSMDPSDAQFMATELAEALTAAHAAGVAHLCLVPDNVIFADNGQIRIAGLGVDAAVGGVTADNPAREDARALGALLYAALTGRWPYGPAHGLPGAPQTDGTPATPRQVRAGVPTGLDEIVDRIMNDPPKRGGSPLTTPNEIAVALKSDVPTAIRRPITDFRADTEAIRPVPPAGLPESGAADWEPSSGMRAARVVVGVLLIGGLLLLSYLFIRIAFIQDGDNTSGTGDDQETESSPSDTPSLVGGPLPIQSVRDFDPEGDDGTEHPEEVGNLIDGDESTAWTTLSYKNDPLTAYKAGVGFIIDLGESRAFTDVVLRMNEGDTLIDLGVADGDTMPMSLADYETVVPDHRSNGGEVTLTPEEPVEARYVLVWFKELPRDPEADAGTPYRARVSSVEVHG